MANDIFVITKVWYDEKNNNIYNSPEIGDCKNVNYIWTFEILIFCYQNISNALLMFQQNKKCCFSQTKREVKRSCFCYRILQLYLWPDCLIFNKSWGHNKRPPKETKIDISLHYFFNIIINCEIIELCLKFHVLSHHINNGRIKTTIFHNKYLLIYP